MYLTTKVQCFRAAWISADGQQPTVVSSSAKHSSDQICSLLTEMSLELINLKKNFFLFLNYPAVQVIRSNESPPSDGDGTLLQPRF